MARTWWPTGGKRGSASAGARLLLDER
jgi:hypothetical protein